LIEEAAKDRNPLAMVQMGLILLDGAASIFHCTKAIEYFAREALSHRDFQQLIEIAKLAIKR
jgi:hypothetical protein